MNPTITQVTRSPFGSPQVEPDETRRGDSRITLPPSHEQPGDIIGRYKLVELLGEGGFGNVWRAEQFEPIHREVALKFIKAGMDSRQIIARFAAEQQALAMMDHPNIAVVLDAGATKSGRPFFVMELVKGVPLTDFCDLKRLSINERLKLFISVCHAVQHAHQKGILHRDLKPSNILVAEVDGIPVPKVIDFGIAKALGETEEQALQASQARTQIGMIIGTPQYMSPEQAGAEPDLDTRSDIYSLGVILYELMVGDTPLSRDQMRRAALDEIMRLVREADAKRPSSRLLPVTKAVQTAAQHRRSDTKRLTHALRGDLDWIVLKTLEKDRGRRYQTASALAADIVRHLHSEPVEAGPPSSGYRLRKFVRRNQMAVGAGLATLFLLIAGVVISTWQAVRATRQTNRAIEAEALATARLKEVVAEKKRADNEATLAKERLIQVASEKKRAVDAEALAMERLKQVAGEKKRADDEAAVAKALNAFLQDDLLLQASSNAQAYRQYKPNPDLTMREALDRAASRIKNRFHDQPLVLAAIRRTIGFAYVELGEADSAVRQLRDAVSLYAQALGPEDVDTLTSRNDLGQAYSAQGDHARAEAEHRAVLAIEERVLGPEHRKTLISRSNLASSLGYQSKIAEAEAEHRTVLSAFERTLGRDHPDTLTCRNNVAYMLKAQGKYPQAKAEYLTIVPLSQRTLGPEHPETLVTRSNLASTLWALGEFAQAETEHRAVLAIRERVLGREHPDTLTTRHNLAVALSAQKKTTEAEAGLRAVLEVRLREFGPEHPDTLSSRHTLATTLQAQGKNPEAEVEHRAVLAIRERVLGVNHSDVYLTCYCLGPCLRAQGKLAEALEFMKRAEMGWTKKLGPQHPYAKGAKTYRERYEAEMKQK